MSKSVNLPRTIENIIIFALFGGLFVYLILRALYVEMTIDESATALCALDLSYETLYKLAGITPGNHLLNTVLIKFLINLFGTHPFVVRLPNLLAFVIFSWFTYRSVKIITADSFIRITAFTLLCLNPYVLDWFTIARGYGLSFGFMMASVYFLLKYDHTGKAIYIHGIFISAILCVLSSFVMVIYYLTLLMCLCYGAFRNILRNDYSKMWRLVAIIILYSVLLILLVGQPVYNLKLTNQFYWGGYTGFWQDTVLSLFRHLIYRGWYLEEDYPAGIFVAIMSIIAVITIALSVIKDKKLPSSLYYALVLLIIPSVISIVQHEVTKTPYLIQRTGLFLYLLSLVSLVLFSGYLVKYWVSKVFIKVLFGFLVVVAGVHALKTLNIRETMDWPENVSTVRALSSFDRYIKDNKLETPVVLRISNVNIYCFDFYNRRSVNPWAMSFSCREILDSAGYYYTQDEKIFSDNKEKIRIIQYFPESGYALIKVRKPEAQVNYGQ